MPRRFLTLVGSMQAKVGFKFVHNGSAGPCSSCQLRKVCIENLEPGRVYEVVSVREMEHSCMLHENGVRAVEVVFSSVPAALEPRQAVKGAILLYKHIDCSQDCINSDLCKPSALRPGDRCVVEEIDGEVDCQVGRKLKIAFLRLTE
ncbi:MAG: UPF0179 family protein [Candidatus Jordarchaeales archaeon]